MNFYEVLFIGLLIMFLFYKEEPDDEVQTNLKD